MSKFGSPLAEAAYLIAGNGFALEEHGSVEEAIGWNALIDLNSTVLLNLGAETELIEDAVQAHPELRSAAGLLVWIREDSYGFVDVVEFGSDQNLKSATDLVNRFTETCDLNLTR